MTAPIRLSPPLTEHQLLLLLFFQAGTYAVCLNHVHIAVCVIIHLLVDVTDSLIAENGHLVLA